MTNVTGSGNGLESTRSQPNMNKYCFKFYNVTMLNISMRWKSRTKGEIGGAINESTGPSKNGFDVKNIIVR